MPEREDAPPTENDIPTGDISLTKQVQLVEREIAELYHHIRQVRAAFDEAVKDAMLRSREQAATILNASTDQIGRWTASGKLRSVDLDRRPRYRLRDLEAFADARLRRIKLEPSPVRIKHPVRDLSQKHDKQDIS